MPRGRSAVSFISVMVWSSHPAKAAVLRRRARQTLQHGCSGSCELAAPSDGCAQYGRLCNPAQPHRSNQELTSTMNHLTGPTTLTLTRMGRPGGGLNDFIRQPEKTLSTVSVNRTTVSVNRISSGLPVPAMGCGVTVGVGVKRNPSCTPPALAFRGRHRIGSTRALIGGRRPVSRLQHAVLADVRVGQKQASGKPLLLMQNGHF